MRDWGIDGQPLRHGLRRDTSPYTGEAYYFSLSRTQKAPGEHPGACFMIRKRLLQSFGACHGDGDSGAHHGVVAHVSLPFLSLPTRFYLFSQKPHDIKDFPHVDLPLISCFSRSFFSVYSKNVDKMWTSFASFSALC